MRNRKIIEEMSATFLPGSSMSEKIAHKELAGTLTLVQAQLIVELLLDIREILAEKADYKLP